ncbi:orotidine-5'-phosphate decarboxylase [Cytobacillus sp. Hz8]|uniref:orotidine-5'-phosphate decarboxylase n=1 Tax=Cytobacillus sp. Hz8 TaxID=3347168 RepID=UPI0035DA87F1
MKNPLIIALDFPNKEEVLQFLSKFSNEKLFVKVGMELFYQEGPQIIYDLKEREHQIFLDLKLHDIPNTVKQAMKGLARMDCDLVNVHAAGGKDMMESALEGLEMGVHSSKDRPKLIAVTQLTSTSEEQMRKEQLIQASLQQSVLHYAMLTQEAGLDGVVCSTHEAEMIRNELGNNFLTVTPGIRLNHDDAEDQKRVATPQIAKAKGVSAIVVGRSITKAEDPLLSYYTIKQAWEGE